MNNERNILLNYEGNQIALFSDENNDYVNLTHLAKAWKYRKSIVKWLQNKQTVEFLNAWEKKHNPKYDGSQMVAVLKLAQNENSALSIKAWIELTHAIGIFTRMGTYAGTYAHKDIAIRFAGWLSPEFELYLVEEIQKLKELERKQNSFELLNREQILFLVRLKEVFKYVVHQEAAEEAHKVVFASKSNAPNPFAEFHIWRDQILNIAPTTINERIKRSCIKNNIAVTKKLLRKTKREKILLLDSYEAVKIAVWDFLNIKGEVNALNLANLVGDMIRTEKGEILQVNEDNLFQRKQDLGNFTNFEKKIGLMKEVKTARELLALKSAGKKKTEPLSTFDAQLKGLLSVPPLANPKK